MKLSRHLLIVLLCSLIGFSTLRAQTFKVLNDSCEQLITIDDYPQALQACGLAIDKGYSEQVPDSMLMLPRFYLAFALRSLGQREAAVEIMEQLASEILATKGCCDDLVAIYDQLVATYSELNDPKRKLEKMEATIACETSLHGDSSDFMITYYYLCADDYIITGDYAKSIQYFERAIELYPHFYPDYRNDATYARFLVEYASPLNSVGKTAKAFVLLDTAWAIIQRAPQDETTLNIKNDILQLRVWFYDGIGDAEHAVDAVLQQIEQGEGMNMQTRANSLVSAALYLINFDIKYGTNVARENNFLDILHNILTVYDSLPPDPIYMSNAYVAIGNYYQVEQIPDSVLHYFRKSSNLIAAAYGKQNVIYLNSLVTQSNYTLLNGDIISAGKILDTVYNLAESFLKSNFLFLSESEQEAVLNDYIPLMNKRNAFYATHLHTFNDVEVALFNSSLFIKGLLLQNITGLRTAVINTGKTDLITLFNEWTNIKTKIAANTVNNKPIPEELTQLAESLEKKILQSKTLSRTINTSTTVRDISQALEKNSAVIDFMHIISDNDDAYYALVLTSGSHKPQCIRVCVADTLSTILERMPGEREAEYIGRLYTIPDKNFPEDNNYFLGTQLYQLLWEPIRDVLGNVSHLYICADGQLHTIAFHALNDSEGVPLTEHTLITYVNSSRDILHISSDVHPDPVLLVGGLNYSRPNFDPYWRYLPGTLNEIESVESKLNVHNIRFTDYRSDHATESALIPLNTYYESMHFATHGFAFPAFTDTILPEYGIHFQTSSDPLTRCGLVLSGGDIGWMQQDIQSGIDNILTGNEIANLDLTHTKLVVLSACETSGGDLRGSEGVYGLQRAFRIAGAGALVISLWQVPDQYTTELMQYFYDAYLNGNAPDVALRMAQRNMQKKSQTYYWAAFKCIQG
ncbi:MAG TPA: CHAT domain-containing protein [Chitinophagales bacterium]|nr:CHAT domain-containing protein [Chitinophagales bacterium]